MAYQFYLAKQNQEKMRAQEHFATIHHTGARLTHDIKNILQSIKASLDILDMEQEYRTASQKLLQTNLASDRGSARKYAQQAASAPKLDTQVNLVDCQPLDQTYRQTA